MLKIKYSRIIKILAIFFSFHINLLFDFVGWGISTFIQIIELVSKVPCTMDN